jgi:hypothetical protein
VSLWGALSDEGSGVSFAKEAAVQVQVEFQIQVMLRPTFCRLVRFGVGPPLGPMTRC